MSSEELARALAPFSARSTELGKIDGAVVVACSGGADSLALLALARATGRETCAVHVDHGLRPGAPDAEIVADAAERFGASFRAVTIAIPPGGNLEARARDARYAALERVRAEVGAELIAVGHTRDDQAETVLLNFLRGSGASGLSGMPERRGRVVRPLLGFRRADTQQVCRRLGLAPVHDPMNDDARFLRVWLRREVIPRLERDTRRDLVDVLARQAEVLRDDDQYLDALASPLLGAGRTLDTAALTGAPPTLARRVIRQWLGAPPPSLEQVEAVMAVARGGARAVELSGGRRIERTAGRLDVIDDVARPQRPVRLEVPGRAGFGRFDIEARIEHAAPAAWPDGRLTAVVDADRVGDSVTVESPAPGTQFRPIGRGGTKKVADALREAGVAAAHRAAHPVVVSSTRSVCWVVGYRIDDHVKVTARTRRYLWFTAVAHPRITSARG